MSKSDPQPEAGTFEDSLTELEKLLGRIESNELSLEDALATYEKGINLVCAAQKMLAEAEQKLQTLTDRQGEPVSSALPRADEE